jgi:hypothetical protein
VGIGFRINRHGAAVELAVTGLGNTIPSIAEEHLTGTERQPKNLAARLAGLLHPTGKRTLGRISVKAIVQGASRQVSVIAEVAVQAA